MLKEDAISLLELIADEDISIKTTIICSKCRGKGTVKENDRGSVWDETCPLCKGDLYITKRISFECKTEYVRIEK